MLLKPHEFCVTIVCDGLHPDDISELRRSLPTGSRYDFKVDASQKVRTEDYPELFVIGIHTKLFVRFSAKWFFAQTGVAALAAILVVPEFRRFFHLDKSETTQQVQTEKQTKPSVAMPSTAPDQPKAVEASQPKKSIPTQKTKTHVTGNDNVAGNNISGGNNITGNNNKTAPTANAPNGIAITGGTVTNPTVNNFNSAPPARRLTDEQKTLLVSCLKSNTGSFIVGAIANNGEAYRYALDFSEVFSAAGWKNEWPAPTATFMIGGGMWSGVHVSIAGTWDDKTQRASIADGSPELTMMNCLNQAKVVGNAIPDKDRHSGSIRIDVSDNP